MDEQDGLDPLDHPERWERLAASIVAEGEPHLSERRARIGLASAVTAWAKPALTVAASVLLLLTTAAALRHAPPTAAAEPEPTLAASVVPESYAAWIMTGYAPTAAELAYAVDEDRR